MGEDNLLIIKIPAKDGPGWLVLSHDGLLASEIGLKAARNCMVVSRRLSRR